MFSDFSSQEIILVLIIFIWTGFVRTGLGFGGAALGLPLMLFISNKPLFWLPIIGIHLLFFTSLTLRSRINDVNWTYLKSSLPLILPATIIGVLGLLKLPNDWLVTFIYLITLFYAILWSLNLNIKSSNQLVDKFLLITGGYIAGTSLTGAPLMVAVYMRNVSKEQLRNTLFVLWFILVSIKMMTFIILNVELHIMTAITLLPVAAIGHFIGLKAHDVIIQNEMHFKKITGLFLIIVSSVGLYSLHNTN